MQDENKNNIDIKTNKVSDTTEVEIQETTEASVKT